MDIFHFQSGKEFKLIKHSQWLCENKTFKMQFNPEPEQKNNLDLDDYISTNTFEQGNKRTAEMWNEASIQAGKRRKSQEWVSKCDSQTFQKQSQPFSFPAAFNTKSA